MNYNIIKELGQGGMATVYLAEHKVMQKPVAVKILDKKFTFDEHIRKRFLAEARTLFTLSHPNIIKVTDLIDDGDTVAFVMEHVDGETLKEYLDRKVKLTDEEIKNIFSQMLDAVGYVHEQGLVHRDIKPSNFMIDKKGKVKLLDFGIAKNTDASSAEYTQTGTGMQMGTPMYMSPEQITETKSVTAQSDIYSLGVVLWQLVTGERPYNTATLSNFQLQLKIVNEPLALTGSVFDTVIKKATEKEVANRYASAAAFLSALQSRQEHSEKTVVNTVEEKTVITNQEKTVFVESPAVQKEIHQTEKQIKTATIEVKQTGRKAGIGILVLLVLIASIVFVVIGSVATIMSYPNVLAEIFFPSRHGAWNESDKQNCNAPINTYSMLLRIKDRPRPANFDFDKFYSCVCEELEDTYHSLSAVHTDSFAVEKCFNNQVSPTEYYEAADTTLKKPN